MQVRSNFSVGKDQAQAKCATMLQNKHERQLYVGNLPPGLNSGQVVDLLNRALIKMNATVQVNK